MSCMAMKPSAANNMARKIEASADENKDADIWWGGESERLPSSLSLGLPQVGGLVPQPTTLPNASVLASLLAQHEQNQLALLIASATTPLISLAGGHSAFAQPHHLLGSGLLASAAGAPAVDPHGLYLSLSDLNAARANSLLHMTPTSAHPSTAASSLLLRQQQAQPPALRGLAENDREQLILDALEKQGHQGRTGTFPQKLHQMLSDLENEEGGTSIASYLPHGRAFVIHNPTDFVQQIMPKYFRMSRYSSFQRQLNLYEFVRVTDGLDKGAYYHDLFVRGRPILASQIRRNKIKGATALAARGLKPSSTESASKAAAKDLTDEKSVASK